MKITPLAETNRDEISPELLKKKKKKISEWKERFQDFRTESVLQP